MEIILKSTLHGLGRVGDVVVVADGYARNFLIPKGLAIPATPSNLKALDEKRKQMDDKARKEIRLVQELADRISQISLTFERHVSEGDRLFGSVTKEDIVTALQEKGIRIEKGQIELERPLKRVDLYNVKIILHKDISSTLKVRVIKKGSKDGSTT